MFEVLALLLFVVAPAIVGYRSASYRAAAIPGVLLIAAVVSYAADPPVGTDEVDVLPGVWILLSALAVLVSLGGAALRQHSSGPDSRQ